MNLIEAEINVWCLEHKDLPEDVQKSVIDLVYECCEWTVNNVKKKESVEGGE